MISDNDVVYICDILYYIYDIHDICMIYIYMCDIYILIYDDITSYVNGLDAGPHTSEAT